MRARSIQPLRSVRVFAADVLALANRRRVLPLLLCITALPIFAALRSTRPSTPLEEKFLGDVSELVSANRDPAMAASLQSVSVGPLEPVGLQVPWPERMQGGVCLAIDFDSRSNLEALIRSWRRLTGDFEESISVDGRPVSEVLAEQVLAGPYDEVVVFEDPVVEARLHVSVRCDAGALAGRELRTGLVRRRFALPNGVEDPAEISRLAFGTIIRRSSLGTFLTLALLLTIPLLASTLRRPNTQFYLQAGASPTALLLGRFAGLLAVVGIAMTFGVVGTALALGEGLDPAPLSVLDIIPKFLVAYGSLLAIAAVTISIGLPTFWVFVSTFGAWMLANQFGHVGEFLARRRLGDDAESLRLLAGLGRRVLPHVSEILSGPESDDLVVTGRTSGLLLILANWAVGRGRVRRNWSLLQEPECTAPND